MADRFVRERLRYDWSEPGAVKGRVIESNIFKPGSTDYLRRFLSEVEAEGREAKPAR